MIRSFFVEFVFPILLFLVLRSLIGNFFQAQRRQRSAPGQAPQPQVTPGGELKKDPVCGTFVSTTTAVTRTSNGQVLYFCSKECASKYRGS